MLHIRGSVEVLTSCPPVGSLSQFLCNSTAVILGHFYTALQGACFQTQGLADHVQFENVFHGVADAIRRVSPVLVAQTINPFAMVGVLQKPI